MAGGELELRVTRADPAGNLTLLIEGAEDLPPARCAALGAELLTRPECRAEQAGFLRENGPGLPRLEMAGGEFCGNAARSFGLLLAERQGLRAGRVRVSISGASAPVDVDVDRGAGTAWAEMPLPESIGEIELPAPFGTCPIVRFEGIWHVLAIGRPASRDSFLAVREFIYAREAPSALGVMFLDAALREMTPVVYVAGPETLYFESSCGSGTTAVACWRGGGEETALRQPGGTLRARARVRNGALDGVRMGGAVRLEPPVTLRVSV